jgi:hypothetical protein
MRFPRGKLRGIELIEIYQNSLNTIRDLHRPSGGFSYDQDENARPDSTAWAIIALSAFGRDEQSCEEGRTYLQKQQDPEGRLTIGPIYPKVSWPTPLAIIAWETSGQYQKEKYLAIQFLINFSGHHFSKEDNSLVGHDPSIKGWPWIADTHSWVIPTGLAIIALQIAGVTHQRILEGQHMILDRQLTQGGWNYGNTSVFGKALLPLPECTGVALHALSHTTNTTLIEKSIDYLIKELPNLRTPISLGWALLGLGAWGMKPSHSDELVLESLHLQKKYGQFPLPSLALLLCAAQAPKGLHSLFPQHQFENPPHPLFQRGDLSGNPVASNGELQVQHF